MKISELLEAWRKAPGEALRELVLAVDDDAPLATLRGLDRLELAELSQRLAAFRTKAKDPRVTRALEQLVTESRWLSDAARPMWRTVFELVSRTGDPRLKHLEPVFSGRPALKAWLTNQYAKAVAGLPASFAPVDETKWKAALAALPRKRAAPDTQDEAALFEAVYASPEDDAPRLVLADLLTARGDPRGEFISLQCGARDAVRERRLLAAHGKQWVAHFGPTLGAEVVWRRGFPAEGLAKFKSRSDAQKYGGLAAWATFEALRWHQQGANSEEPRWTRFVGPHFQALRRATGVHSGLLLDSPRPFARLEELATWWPDAATLARFVSSKNFPRLHTLDLEWLSLSWVKPLASLGAVKVVRLGSPDDLEAWLDELARFPSVEEVQLAHALRFRRAKSGALSRLIVETAAGEPERHASLSDWLPDGLVEALEVVGDGALPPEVEQSLRALVGTRGVAKVKGAVPPLSGRTPLEWLDAQTVAVSQGAAVLIIDVSGAVPRLARELPAQGGQVAVAALEGGRAVLTASSRRLEVLDAVTGAERFSLEHASDSSVVLNFTADRARVSRRSGVYDLSARAPLPPPRGAKGDLRAPDDSCWLRHLRADIWARDSVEQFQLRFAGARDFVLEDAEGISGVHFIADGLVARHPKRGLVKWSRADGRVVAEVAAGEASQLGARVSTNHRFVVTNDGDDGLVVATLPELKCVGRASVDGKVTSFAVSDDGTRVVVCTGEALQVVVAR